MIKDINLKNLERRFSFMSDVDPRKTFYYEVLRKLEDIIFSCFSRVKLQKLLELVVNMN